MNKPLLFVLMVLCGVGAFVVSGIVAIVLNRPEATVETVMTGAPVFYTGGMLFGMAVVAYFSTLGTGR